MAILFFHVIRSEQVSVMLHTAHYMELCVCLALGKGKDKQTIQERESQNSKFQIFFWCGNSITEKFPVP